MRFPRFHLAASVVNRVLDVFDEVQSTPEPTEPPQLPDATAAGQQLDQALNTPPAAVPAPAGSEDAALLEMQQGGTAADAVSDLALLDSMGAQ